MVLLLEGKRDNLLLPYFELVKDKIPELTLGKFKGLMLDKLAAQGNINNLSLGSNFYLAGATRYYFQGQLTTNGHANLLDGDLQTPDVWDSDACKKLNALINVLRNSFIDSIGTKMEIEEDFGTLPINKLFRKYGKKIDAEMGIERNDSEAKKEVLDRSNRVGNGYTFDIIYSYNDATKYNEYTSPGAWCITYGMNHYRYYMDRLNIHYVIFLKDGYQNIPRETGPGFTKQKPHDEYGNSMIAFLQKNNSWEPTYITSRWNHGYGNTSGTEADYAYNLEEFCNITGVTPKDLERIYKIWKTDNKEKRENQPIDRAELKVAMTGALRRLKYAQMVINNGHPAEEALSAAEAVHEGVLYGDENSLKKNVSEFSVSDGDFKFTFITDRGNVVFDSFSNYDNTNVYTANGLYGDDDNQIGADIIILDYGAYNKIYSVRYHSFVDIGGVTKFKRLPSRVNNGKRKPLYMEIKNSFKDIALLSFASCKPLKLPNGQYWFNDIRIDDPASRWKPRNEIISDVIYEDCGSVIEITYDESSGEKYFYSLREKKFMNFLDNITNTEEVTSYSRNAIENPADYIPLIAPNFHSLRDYFGLIFSPDGSTYHATKTTILDYRGNEISIYGETRFSNACGVYGQFIKFSEEKGGRYYDPPTYLYDTKSKKMVAVGNEPLKIKDYNSCGRYYYSWDGTAPKYLFITPRNGDRAHDTIGKKMIYDTTVGLFIKDVKNNTMFFNIEEEEEFDGRDIFASANDGWDFWAYYNSLPSAGRNTWDECMKEKRKHMVCLDNIEKEYVPNNMPINDEYAHKKEENVKSMPSYSLTENDIREAVENAIKKIIR